MDAFGIRFIRIPSRHDNVRPRNKHRGALHHCGSGSRYDQLEPGFLVAATEQPGAARSVGGGSILCTPGSQHGAALATPNAGY